MRWFGFILVHLKVYGFELQLGGLDFFFRSRPNNVNVEY